MNNVEHFTNRPCASHGLKSYRYLSQFGWVMIGAKDQLDALCEAFRSISPTPAVLDKLEIWDGIKYVKVLK